MEISSINYREFCNFEIKDVSLKDIRNVTNDDTKYYVDIEVEINGNGDTFVSSLPLNALDDADFRKINPGIRFHPGLPPTRINRIIVDYVKSCLEGCVKHDEVFQFTDTGMYKVNGETVFCTGDEVITPRRGTARSTRFDIHCGNTKLDYDPGLTEYETLDMMLELISLCPAPGVIILSQQITYLLRRAYVEARANPCICTFLYGETGKKKTTFASFLTQIYNRSDGINSPVRLNATISAAVDYISQNRDCVIVLDDLFPSDSTQIRRKQEETLSEIVRCIGDRTTPAKMRGKHLNTVEPKCGVLFTGEYIIGEGSDAARIIPVEMDEIDNEHLRFFQDNPLIVSTFYRNFIQWSIDNYNDIVQFMKDKLQEYCQNKLDIHARLQQSLYFLDTSYYLLLSYCLEVGLITEEQSDQLYDSFLEHLQEVAYCQNRRVGKKIPATESTTDYWHHILNCYHNHEILYAKDCESYREDIHDALTYNDFLCLRGDWLEKAFPNVSLSEIGSFLNEMGVLEVGKKGYTKQISKLNGKRFYFIRRDALNDT